MMATIYSECKIYEAIRQNIPFYGHNFHGITGMKKVMVRIFGRQDPTEAIIPLNITSVEMGLLRMMTQERLDQATDVSVRGVQFYMKVEQPNSLGFKWDPKTPICEGWELDLQIGRHDSVHLINRDSQAVIHARVGSHGKVFTLRIMGRDGFQMDLVQQVLKHHFGRELSAHGGHHAVLAVSFGLPVKVGLPNIVFEGRVDGQQLLKMSGADIQLKVTQLLQEAVVCNKEIRAVQELKVACGVSISYDMRYSSGPCKSHTRFFSDILCQWFQVANPFTTSSSISYEQSQQEEVDLFRDEMGADIQPVFER